MTTTEPQKTDTARPPMARWKAAAAVLAGLLVLLYGLDVAWAGAFGRTGTLLSTSVLTGSQLLGLAAAWVATGILVTWLGARHLVAHRNPATSSPTRC